MQVVSVISVVLAIGLLGLVLVLLRDEPPPSAADPETVDDDEVVTNVR
jgi:hypothetical protein